MPSYDELFEDINDSVIIDDNKIIQRLVSHFFLINLTKLRK